ncbi:MAG: Crp/Fnr family transcriptional regulator, partial [Cytophagia bacterium]|nr:Crp/Fnr family transcriptional regulator [Cytophagia bacterium]
MTHPLINYFSHFTTFTPEEEKAILDSMTIHHFKKDEVILKANAVDQSTFFVIKGLVRKHKLVDGNDLTLDFFAEDEWIISLNSFTEGKPVDYCLTCLEDTELITGNEASAQALFKIFPRFETISRAVLESTFMKKQEMLHAFQTDSPVQR